MPSRAQARRLRGGRRHAPGSSWPTTASCAAPTRSRAARPPPTGCSQAGVTGIVCASDPLALGAIRAVRRAGLRVPDDVSVVGYDDSAFMNCTEPPLTTVRQPIEPMGRAAIDLLVGLIAGATVTQDELLFEPELVVRGSTGPCPGRRCPPRRTQPAARTLLRGRDASSCRLLPTFRHVSITTLSGSCVASVESYSFLVTTRRGAGDACSSRTAPGTRAGTRVERSRPATDDPQWWRGAVIYQVYSAASPTGTATAPATSPASAARLPVPARARRRRDLVHALVRLAARRRRVRRRRLPRDRPAVRHARGGRGAHRRGARARASAPSSTSSPTTSPTSTRGSRRRSPPAPARRSASGSGSAPARARTATEAPNAAGCPTSRAAPGPGRRTRTARRASGTCTCSRPSSPTSTGSHPDVRAEFEDVLRFWFDRGVGRHPDRLGRAAGQGRRRSPEVPTIPAAGEHPHVDRDELHDVYRSLARGRRLLRRARACSSARCGCRTPSGSRSTCGPTRCTPPSTSTSWPARGTPGELRASIDMTLAAHAPGRRAGDLGAVQPRRHAAGHPLRPRGHARSPSAPSGSARRPTSRSARAGPAPPRCSPRRCPARSTSTRATSSVCPRSRTSRSSAVQDPMHVRSGGVDPGRDGCRVPLPWSGDEPPYGFSPAGADASPGCRSPPPGRS